jgi:ribosome-binding protein aMBF1 (putative translation factor)
MNIASFINGANMLDKIFGTTIPFRIQRFSDYSMGIALEIARAIEKKGWEKTDLAAKLGKEESKVTEYLSGNHNFTLKTIIKLEETLGENLIILPAYQQKDLEGKQKGISEGDEIK